MSKLSKIVVINGPNLNLLGEREPQIYGKTSLPEIERRIKARADELGCEVACHQSNDEGGIIDLLHANRSGITGIILNAAGYSHTSVAILDALQLVEVPVIEVHISNIYAREDYRHTSLTARGCVGVISGLGIDGYIAALEYLLKRERD